jgi:hypothetical protein
MNAHNPVTNLDCNKGYINKKLNAYHVFSCDFETEQDISFVDSKIHKCYIEHVKLNLTYPTQWRS